jgi:hypothetical protein
MQDELPHAGTLQKAAYPLEKWNHDNVGARSWYIAGAQHPDTVEASTSSLARALLQGHAAHASTEQEESSDAVRHDSSAYLEAVHASPRGEKMKGLSIQRGQSECKSQQSDETDYLCIQNAASSKFRALVDPTEEVQTSIEQLSSIHRDPGPLQPSVAAFSGTCLACLPRESASLVEAQCSSQHDSNSVGGSMSYNVDALREGKDPCKDGGDEGTSTCYSTNAGGIRRQALVPRLLGQSGQVSKAVHEALKEVQEVHCSDELMHFEFFGPFWELSEVRAVCC